MSDELREIVIQYGGAGSIGGTRFGVGNLWEREYSVPGGGTRRGPSVVLFISNGEQLVVGQDSIFAMGGSDWKVADLEPESPRGHIRLTKVDQ